MAIPVMDSVDWLEMMAAHSPLTDCKPHFARIAEEIRQLRRAAGDAEDLRGIIGDLAAEIAGAERRIIDRITALQVDMGTRNRESEP